MAYIFHRVFVGRSILWYMTCVCILYGSNKRTLNSQNNSPVGDLIVVIFLYYVEVCSYSYMLPLFGEAKTEHYCDYSILPKTYVYSQC